MQKNANILWRYLQSILASRAVWLNLSHDSLGLPRRAKMQPLLHRLPGCIVFIITEPNFDKNKNSKKKKTNFEMESKLEKRTTETPSLMRLQMSALGPRFAIPTWLAAARKCIQEPASWFVLAYPVQYSPGSKFKDTVKGTCEIAESHNANSSIQLSVSWLQTHDIWAASREKGHWWHAHHFAWRLVKLMHVNTQCMIRVKQKCDIAPQKRKMQL